MERRDSGFVWVTWISKLISGDAKCYYGPWLRANYHIDSLIESDFSEWQKEHDEVVKDRYKKYSNEDYTVSLSHKNDIALKNKSDNILRAKPDIIAIKKDTIIFEDVRHHKYKDYNIINLMIYLLSCKDHFRFRLYNECFGIIWTPNENKKITMVDISDKFKENLSDKFHILTSDTQLDATPSPEECRYCRIPKRLCDKRIGDSTNDDAILVDFL